MEPSIALFTDSHGLQIVRAARKLARVSVIVSSESRPQYRGDLKSAAEEVGALFLEQPKLTDERFQFFVRALELANLDVLLCCSYSRLIPPQILRLARHGGVNIHYALLPRNRGKHPIQWAILNGEKVTGVTLHEMSPIIDEGPIIDQSSTPIYLDDTWQSVTKRLDRLAGDLIVKHWDSILSGTWTGSPQNDALSTRGKPRDTSDGKVDWNWPVIKIHNVVRALVPPLPPAFYLDQEGSVCEITGYLPIRDVFQLKHRLNPEAFLSPLGMTVPLRLSSNEGSAADFPISFRISSDANRNLATFEVFDYRYESSIARIRFSAGDGSLSQEEFALLRSYSLAWVTSELALKSLVETS